MRRLKGAIFDLDGTILDSMYVWRTLGEEYLISKNVIPPVDIRKILKPMSMQEAAQYFRESLGIKDSENTIIDEINGIVQVQYEKHVQLKPFVLDAVKKLKDNGAKLCIATATDRILVEAALKRLKIMDYFDFILTCTEVGKGKDNPLIYNEALSNLELSKNDVAVFEDAIHAIKTAKDAGFRICGIYEKTFEKNDEEIRSMTEWFLYSWEEF